MHQNSHSNKAFFPSYCFIGAARVIASFDCLVSHFYKISRCLPRYIFRISTFALSVERFREEKASRLLLKYTLPRQKKNLFMTGTRCLAWNMASKSPDK
jgi:hypothetical protein